MLASLVIRPSLLALLLLASACAVPPVTRPADATAAMSWRGRLALRVQADAATGPAQSMTSSFALSGTPQHGELTLYTALGTTAAQLDWTGQDAVLRRNAQAQRFASLNDLIRYALGTEVPVTALFAWLAGEPVTAQGWSADLSRHADGHILARRTWPAPAAEIRLLLEP